MREPSPRVALVRRRARRGPFPPQFSFDCDSGGAELRRVFVAPSAVSTSAGPLLSPGERSGSEHLSVRSREGSRAP